MAGVQSIERAFSLLRTLAAYECGVTELANRVDLPKSTVSRLLNALEAEGVIERDETESQYRLSIGFGELFGGNPQRNLIEVATPYLVELSSEINEGSGLDTYDDGWIQFVDQVHGDNDVQVRDWTGESGRAHALPAGIVILAHLPEAELNRYLAQELEELTPATTTDPDRLVERIAHARSVGYAWGFEEFAEGINSVAAPVFDHTGVVAALRVHGPTYRFPNPNLTHDIGRTVADAASRLSQQLQGSGRAS